MGVQYSGNSNVLTLSSQIHVELGGPEAAVIEAERGTITNDPRQIVLEHPHLDRSSGTVDADRATLDLTSDNHVERVLAAGNVNAIARTNAATASQPTRQKDSRKQVEPTRAHADQAEFSFLKNEDVLRSAVLRGNVHIEQTGLQPLEGDAGRIVLDFTGQNELRSVHAVDGAHLHQKAANRNLTAGKKEDQQDFELTAPVIDFTVADGHILRHAATSGPPQIVITRPGTSAQTFQKTVVTAGKFDADFAEAEGRNHLARVHGRRMPRL